MDVFKHFKLHPNVNIPLFQCVEWHIGISISGQNVDTLARGDAPLRLNKMQKQP